MRGIKLLIALALSIPASLLFAVSLTNDSADQSHVSYAATADTSAVLGAFDEEVERTSLAYFAAIEQLERLNAEIENYHTELARLEREIPDAQYRLQQSAKNQYMMAGEENGLLIFILTANSFSEVITKLDYAATIAQSNSDNFIRLGNLRSDSERIKNELEVAQAKAQAEADAAEIAMAEALTARQTAYEIAVAKAKGANVGVDYDGSIFGDLDWSMAMNDFVSEWSGRINSYLAGSALAGTGTYFAIAAWQFGVDPRISPAISMIESSKGAYCFNAYNAWGWGNYSWNSWQEAIHGHVGGWARGYGASISIDSAYRYCPPNAQGWYNSVTYEMSLI